MNKNIDLSGAKVMLVDDTPANIDVMRKTLEPEGYNISMAPNGEVALKVIPRSMPELILLDVMMPGIDGFETCRQLKANEATKGISIIFITAKSEIEDLVKGFSMGAVDYITKPFRQEEVTARVRSHLTISHLMKENSELIYKLQCSNEELKTLNDDKNRFLGMAVHDIRNPLNSIKGFSEILMEDEEEPLTEEQEESVEIIHDVSISMLDLINDLLDINSIQRGELKLKPEKGMLKETIEKQVKINKKIADKKHISINSTFADMAEMSFDHSKVAQVIDNLISNAIKYSPSNSSIHIKTSLEDGMAKVSVKDSGEGLSKEDQEKICTPFQKLSARPTNGESSTGLGLSIVKKILDTHNGELSIESELGKGSTFSFTIPVSA